MEKIFRKLESHDDAEQAVRQEDNLLTYAERFEAFMQLMEPYYDAACRFQRVYRADDLKRRSVCDDWGLRIQSVQEPELLQNKRSSARPKDLADVKELEAWLLDH